MDGRHVLLLVGLILSLTNAQARNAYDKVTTEMQQIAAANPGMVTMMDIGTNDQGQPIYGMRIEASTLSAADKSQHLVVGAHHGNEQLSVDVAMSFARQLIGVLRDTSASQYAKLSPHIYYVIPALNISGYNTERRQERHRSGSMLDANRDYPDPCTDDEPFQLASTKNLAEFVGREHIVSAVTIHGYIGTFTFPWGIFATELQTPDHATFTRLARQSVQVSGYRSGTHGEVIYPTAGAFEDWAYFQHGVWVMLLEIARTPDIVRDAQSLLTYFAMVPSERSFQHGFTGRCLNLEGKVIQSRP